MQLDTINSSLFSFKNNTFVAEISGLPGYRHSQIFQDACDEGIAIRSAKTGKELSFAYVGIDSDGEETYGWRYECVDRNFRHLKILVIND